MVIIYFILALTLLYFTKTWLTKKISQIVHRVGGGRNTTIWLWSIFFLPGTIIHELSHFLTAAATGARTGKIEILPEFIEEGSHDDGVVLGSVQTQKLNPIQGFLVGMAPFITGLISLLWLSSLISSSLGVGQYYHLAFYLYLFFVIANSFFPSWSDIRQTLPLVVIFLTAFVVFIFINSKHTIYLPKIELVYLTELSKIIVASSMLNILVTVAISIPHTLLAVYHNISTPKSTRS